LVDFVSVMAFWVKDREAVFTEAIASAKRSLALDDGNSSLHAHYGMLLMYEADYDQARIHFDRALALNPSDAKAYALFGFFLTAIGRPDDAIKAFNQSAHLDPFQPGWINWLKGIAHFTAHRYGDAVTSLKAVTKPMNEVRGWMAMSLAYAGEAEQSRRMLNEFLAVAETDMADPPSPDVAAWAPFWHGAIPYRNQEDTDHLHEGLRKAGMAG
jgi:adenylate cyclase